MTKQLVVDEEIELDTTTKPTAQPFRFGFLVHDVSRMRRTLFDDQMKPLGVTRSQWSVLAYLSRESNNGTMQVDLARDMDVGKVTIGGLIDRLESSGHVERRLDARDRRARRIFITEKGFETIRRMQTVGAELNDRVLEGISERDLKVTEKTLARVKENIRSLLHASSANV
ncbi:MarR family winged helix-turn-helix transcriptional regulator [Sphingomonas sp. Tas61C01]|uniref:MarR family winged helix-turn-helix transcriptional regulator n=1 Tax=Sphingomonas sp. Tas61C01 TaxID=3458297 RepID=UPI00403EB909